MEVNDDIQTLLDEQRREIAAAEAAEYDLVFAYQLQVEEAVHNSLPKDAPSGSKLTFYDDDVIPENSVPALFGEELSKYEQRVHDRERAEAEMKRIEDDLSRRIHDQAFARELLNVPDREWEKTGDHLDRPYGEDSSKGVGQNRERFRVFVKGLMGEDVEESGFSEAQKKSLEKLAGIGVAICDPSGILVFEVSKGLEEVLSDEIAELKALIEGLDVAVMLGLKRVNVVLDSQTILQYVRGKVQPVDGNVADLVKQTTSRLTKFMDCIPSLATQIAVNFAVKLATDAIVSQVNGAAENSLRKRKKITETCTICLQDADTDQMFLINGCLHYYCFSCMNKHVEAKLHQGMLPECPHDGCKFKLTIDSCKKFLKPELYDLMSERVKEATIPITEKVYCPDPKCSTLMSTGGVRFSDQAARTCAKCHLVFCINCKVPWHQNMTCFEYRRLNPYKCVDDPKLKSLAAQSDWRQCVKCNHLVSLGEGCYHIYCRCGHEFCYTCGAEWKHRKPTCSCPLWNEANIIYGNRRQPRRG